MITPGQHIAPFVRRPHQTDATGVSTLFGLSGGGETTPATGFEHVAFEAILSQTSPWHREEQ